VNGVTTRQSRFVKVTFPGEAFDDYSSLVLPGSPRSRTGQVARDDDRFSCSAGYFILDMPFWGMASTLLPLTPILYRFESKPKNFYVFPILPLAMVACGGGGSTEPFTPASSNWDEMVWDQSGWA